MNYIINPEYRGSICEIRSYRNELMAVGIVSEVGEDYIKIAPKSGSINTAKMLSSAMITPDQV